jgi:hypothetical protein
MAISLAMDALPDYRRQRSESPVNDTDAAGLVEQAFTLTAKDGTPWATLRISSRSSDKPPVFHNGDVVSGMVDLHVRCDDITAVTISVSNPLALDASGLIIDHS